MGNKKNKRNHRNDHRRSMKRRWHYLKYQKKAAKQKRQLEKIQVDSSEQLKGSRIVNLDKLQEYIDRLVTHAVQCGSQIILSGENRNGLASILSSRCSKCSFMIPLSTSRKVVGPKGKLWWEANLAAVWGQMSSGVGYAKLHETMSTLGVPVMSPKNFIRTEQAIGEYWQEQLQDVMAEAGREEKRLAEERRDYHQGVPAITVIVDAGWSKRSHCHSYNAKSGVGIS